MNFVKPDTVNAMLDTLSNVVDTTSTTTYIEPVTSNLEYSGQGFGFMMFQMILMLIVISVMLYIALYFFKKLNNKYTGKSKILRFKHHETLYLAQKQGLSAVSFAKKLYIIGFSQNSVNVIDIIDDPELIASLTTEIKSKKSFVDLLKKHFSQEK